MRKLITILVTLFAASSAHAAGSCPDRTNEEWQVYLNNLATTYPGFSFNSVNATMSSCAVELDDRGLGACFANLRGLTRAKANNGRDDMGFNSENSTYLANQPQAMMQLPPELANGLPSNWKQIAIQKGWPFLEYSSRTVPNPPNFSYKRVLFYVSQPGFDRWIQFTQPEDSRTERLIDFITVQKQDGGEAINPPRIHFRQYWRDSSGRNPQLKHTSSDNCYSCHPGGMRQLSPKPGSMSTSQVAGDNPSIDSDDRAYERYQQFNRIMSSYGNTDWNGEIIPKDHGPPMGRTAGCIRCHDGGNGPTPESRGALNSSTFMDIVDHKINTDQTMPPLRRQDWKKIREKLLRGKKLDDDEEKLFKRVRDTNRTYLGVMKAEYLKDTRAWLKAVACPATPLPVPVVVPASAETSTTTVVPATEASPLPEVGPGAAPADVGTPAPQQ